MFVTKLAVLSLAWIGTSSVVQAGPILESTVCAGLDAGVHHYLPNSDCSGFYQCYGETYWGFNPCPAGLLFNDQINVCDWPANVQCGAAGSGDCCFSNGSPGCQDLTCQAAICAADPFCCGTSWDNECANAALGSGACVCTPPACEDVDETLTIPYTSSGQDLIFNFTTGPAEPGSTVKITAYFFGDIDGDFPRREVVRVRTEPSSTVLLGRLGVGETCPETNCCEDSKDFYIDADTFNTWQNDGTVTIELDATSSVNTFCSGSNGKVTLEYKSCSYA